MRRLFAAALIVALALAGCEGAPPTIVVPTEMVLPTLTPSPIPPTHTPAPIAAAPTEGEAPSETPTQTSTDAPPLTASLTPTPSLTPLVYLSPTPTATASPTLTPSNTYTPTLTATYTPSLTITPTITYTPSLTRLAPLSSATPEDVLGLLALLAEDATILPPEVRIPAPTLTLWARTAFAPTVAPTPTVLAPPPLNCLYPPPGNLSLMLSSDPALLPALGCAQGAPPVAFQVSGAWQFFERGVMLYLAGAPGHIYVLTNDTRFRRYDDTFVQGVDPESGGEVAPPGLVTPVRGFGKVWRSSPDVRNALGWAVVPETGGMLVQQNFERGRALFLPARGETILLVDDANSFGLVGSWRVLPGGF
jgi:hypothetical protein